MEANRLSGSTFSLLFFFAALVGSPYPVVVFESGPPSEETDGTDFVRGSCEATLYPDLCYATLAVYAPVVKGSHARLAQLATSLSIEEAKNVALFLSNFTAQAGPPLGPRMQAALSDCCRMISDAVRQIRESLSQMRRAEEASDGSFRFRMADVQTWMSAALTNEETCTDGFDGVAERRGTTADVCDQVDSSKRFTSNALALINVYVQSVNAP